MFGVKNDFATIAFVITSLFVKKASFSGFKLQPYPVIITGLMSLHLIGLERLS